MGLFGKKSANSERLRLYYASDIHGTEVLWRKFLRAPEVYKAEVLVMGGDLTGKAVVPLVEAGGERREAQLFGERVVADGEEQVRELEDRVRANGMYPYRMTGASPASRCSRWSAGSRWSASPRRSRSCSGTPARAPASPTIPASG
ncbi:MAG: hypothetical protein P8Y53_16285 [Pseudolabrys sp.]